MNSAEYVGKLISDLKAQGMDKQSIAWKAANACVGWPYIFGDRGDYCTIAHRKAKATKYPVVATKCKAISGKTDSCSGCKWFPKGKRVRAFDCRGFTYWILLQVYNWKLMGTGCTTQWDNQDNWKAKGKISDGIPKDTLVCLFYSKDNKEKVWEHTGFGLNGETVECSAGVQYHNKMDKKWTHWGVPACIEGDVPTPTPTPTPDPGDQKPTLRKGDSGPYVTLAQTELMQKGYALPKYGADGKFGTETETAVKELQKANGLTVDGIIGPKTWEILDSAKPTVFYTVHVPHLPKLQAEALLARYVGAYMTAEEG